MARCDWFRFSTCPTPLATISDCRRMRRHMGRPLSLRQPLRGSICPSKFTVFEGLEVGNGSSSIRHLSSSGRGQFYPGTAPGHWMGRREQGACWIGWNCCGSGGCITTARFGSTFFWKRRVGMAVRLQGVRKMICPGRVGEQRGNIFASRSPGGARKGQRR